MGTRVPGQDAVLANPEMTLGRLDEHDAREQRLKVFLCHANEDKAAVRGLHGKLIKAGYDPWLDTERLLPGHEWELEIRKAVRESDVVIVCLSKNAVTKRGFVQKEIKLALDVADEQPEGAIFIIPAKLGQCDVPERLRQWQWVDLTKEGGHEDLLRALHARSADTLGQEIDVALCMDAIISCELLTQLYEWYPMYLRPLPLARVCALLVRSASLPDFLLALGLGPQEVDNVLMNGGGPYGPDAVSYYTDLKHELRRAQTATPRTAPASTVPSVVGEVTINEIDGTELILVPAGEFTMGSNDHGENERPERTVYLDAYCMARHPVTNAQYGRFLKEAGHEGPRYWNDSRFNRAGQPVVAVTWHDAQAYCEWAALRLPTEAEWEKAARGTDGRTWPWGDEPPNGKVCNFGRNVGTVTEIRDYPEGASPYGCQNMAGNLWEWCQDWSGRYELDQTRNPQGPRFGSARVLRGGCWASDKDGVRCSSRFRGIPLPRAGLIGFRCAR